jgi:C-terminal processing protease CtpA/Prc
MMSGIAGHLIGDGNVRLGRMQTRQAALEFRVNPRVVLPDGRATMPYRGPVAVLVDELTASTSECFTGALQDLRRARVFGRPTMGEALPALTKRLSNGDVLMYAIGNFVTGTGRSLERNGVQPDEVVPLSVDALAGGRDETVEAALRWLDTKPLALTAPLLLSSNDLQARQSFRVSRRRPTPARRGQATLKRSAPRNRSADRSAPGTADPAVKDSEHSAMDSLREK